MVFFYHGVNTLFLFGEVKTSSDNSHPPRVSTSSSGLKKQLQDLISCNNNRRLLIYWLGHKVGVLEEDNVDRQDYTKALKSYIRVREQIKIVGVLIRDVDSDKKDLESTLEQLQIDLPAQMHLELLALYFTIKIDTFLEKINGES